MRLRAAPLLLTWLAAAAIAGSAGCLDEEGAFECAKPAATGGDFVGRWEVLDLCYTVAPTLDLSCPQLKMTTEGISAGGWVEFHADGSYQGNNFVSLGRRFDFPLSCIANYSGTCHDLAPLLDKRFTDNGGGEVTVFCRGSSHCDCSSRTVLINDKPGSVRREGNRLIEGMTALEYSVVGNEMRLAADSLVYRFARQ